VATAQAVDSSGQRTAAAAAAAGTVNDSLGRRAAAAAGTGLLDITKLYKLLKIHTKYITTHSNSCSLTV